MPKTIPDFGTYTSDDFIELVTAAVNAMAPQDLEPLAVAIGETDPDTLMAMTDAFTKEVRRKDDET